MPLNFEFKARTNKSDELEGRLLLLEPRFAGIDYQTDTYFHVSNGRMKLREGNIENHLIHYTRENTASGKQSNVMLYATNPGSELKQLLTAALGIKVVVEKQRKIYFAGNVKIHFDIVPGLGSFIEVEAIDHDGSMGVNKLREQCSWFAEFFGVADIDFESHSYSDLLLDM